MPLTTPITELFDIRHPVLLAPMAGASGGALAAAVSAAGGLGLIGGGYGSARQLESEFTAAGNARVGVGFITWSLARQPALLSQALEHAPAAVFLSFGDDAPFVEEIHKAGAKLISQVQTVEQARAAADAGADVIVAQGSEAGGHGATRGTFALVPAVVDAVAPLPVLAAGGVGDGRGLGASLLLGAAGALVGTRFLATTECLWPEGFKQRLLERGGDDTLRTSLFDRLRGLDWPVEFTGRVLRNASTKRWQADPPAAGDDAARRDFDAAANDDADIRALHAGEILDLVDSVIPAAELVEQIVAKAEAELARAARLVT
jgi:nitronate monooxygenase